MCDIKEQWGKDVADYGDNAYLMLESPYTKKDNNPNAKTIDLFIKIPSFGIRQESAALPFDLERAKAGDAIERIVLGKWYLCNFKHVHEITGRIVVEHWGNGYVLEKSELRMKYPQKVKK